MTPVQIRALDKVADRLGALYQHAGRMMPDETDQKQNWTHLLDEIVNLTVLVERVSNRSLRERDLQNSTSSK